MDGVAARWELFEDEDWFGEPLAWGSDGVGPVVFGPGTPLLITTEIALGADPDADPGTWVWENITPYVRYEAGITATTGRQDERSRVSPGNGHLVVDNRDGRFSRHNPTGPYYGQLSRNTPIRVLVNAGNVAYPVLQMFVNEWPARWDKSSTDFTVPIRTGGILRRLQQGGKPFASALRRAIGAYFLNTVAYWPMEDGTDADTFAPAVLNGSPLSIYGTTVAPGSSSYADGGTDPLPVISAGTAGFASGPITSYTSPSPNEWAIGALFYFTAAPDSSTNQRLLEWHTEGSLIRWAIYWTDATDTLKLEAFDRDGSVAFTQDGNVITNANMTNRWIAFWATAYQNGSAVDYTFGHTLLTDDPTYRGHQTVGPASAAAHTLGNIVSVKVSNGGAAGDCAIGHLWVLDTYLNPLLDYPPHYSAINGHLAERADERIARLCDEEGVTVVLQPRKTNSESMGKQTSDTFLNLVRECELADGGVLYEDGFGLGYQPLSARYNTDPALVLDFAQGHIGELPEPTDDDQAIANSVTINRTFGGAALFEDQDSIDLDGIYETADTVNLWKTSQCVHSASWRVHLGTINGHRWPSIGLNLANQDGRTLIEPWTGLLYGSRMTVANPPYQVTGDPIDVFIEGRTERLNQFLWSVDLNAVPAAPYARVFTLEHPVLGRLDTSGSSLATGMTGAPAQADAEDTDLIVVSDADAANFDVGHVVKLYTYTARDKEQTQTFTVTSKTPDGFGFTRIFYTPDSAEITRGVFGGLGSDYIKRVDETALSVQTDVGDIWEVTGGPTANFPFDIGIEGERMTVTAITGAASPQDFTVIRAVNGVHKYHGAGVAVALWQPAVFAK